MANTKTLVIFSILGLVGLTQGCLQLWNNQCRGDWDCCSGFCDRPPSWATGVCKNRGGGGGGGGGGSPGGRSGICSWYGADGEIPQGHPTACGNGFDRFAMTAAQPDVPGFPCGTRVRVTNLDNGRTVDVTVNDKGPNGHSDRIMDLTWAAFGAIENHGKGLTRCSYQVI